ncbi:GrpB family protein [Anaerocolumna sp. MB42-C2]|uniref:GrpB family protein n=1 Tax=Anaerocolumna sp. MB42-C2 TaxID=3070997 RepID=UPI002ED4CE6D
MKKVIVVPYDKAWKTEFDKIKEELLNVLNSHMISIEHVGSTSVEGLAAKPIIDIDIIIKDYNSFESIKSKLASIDYFYEGDLGIKDRQVFKYEEKPNLMRHHLYVCPEYSEELKRHIAFRDYLRMNQKDRDWYGEVKLLAAKYYAEDIDGYMKAKKPCGAEILRRCGL